MRFAVLASVLATTAVACRAPTEPDAVDVRFSSYLVALPAADSLADAITATGTTGAVVVVGRLKTETACFALAPRVRRTGPAIVAIIDVRETEKACPGGAASYGYTLRIGRLPPGDYDVSIIYDLGTAFVSTAWTPLEATLHVF